MQVQLQVESYRSIGTTTCYEFFYPVFCGSFILNIWKKKEVSSIRKRMYDETYGICVYENGLQVNLLEDPRFCTLDQLSNLKRSVPSWFDWEARTRKELDIILGLVSSVSNERIVSGSSFGELSE
eukprot:TRINITY_DN10576_c0_g1_i1.p1 TRINITY_DN10576_c0_g1~~TRINITY_DN10576_c0_g1_i1.p1  ORF type:complete len:125 (-),score=6.75 TRINITY_DN10576_c0_g1_i1:10-384(-)